MKGSVKSFRLKSEYLTSVLETKPIRLVLEDGRVIEGTSQAFIDHPKFTQLREKLEKLGYIKVERGWWNGDRVLTRFKLNGILFKKDEQFSCASALAIHFQVKKKNKK